ncbi:hypothetical protein ABTZ59_22955 [Streptomyces sp. NPDC094034]|uniref:hypothetical protein n=1 Tax=Streptomyces sp. NPDC094034 TaxID=3155309 RepID=UPI00332FADDB
MRTFKRSFTVGALTVPLMLGCAGLAAAEDDYRQGEFTAGLNSDGVSETNAFAGADGIGGADLWTTKNEDGSYSFTNASATWSMG